MTIRENQIGVMSTEQVDYISYDLTDTLDGDETISSVTSVAETSSILDSVASGAVKSSEWTSRWGETVAANKGVQAVVTAGTTTGRATIKWVVVTSKSRTLPLETQVDVV